MKQRRKLWVRKRLLRRESHGGSARLLKELAAEDHSEYRSFMRMTPDRFEDLVQKVSGVIQRSDTYERSNPWKSEVRIGAVIFSYRQ
jgi:ElaB/YqjD/DUF883 family membrane-anchored ribosome-binding protein